MKFVGYKKNRYEFKNEGKVVENYTLFISYPIAKNGAGEFVYTYKCSPKVVEITLNRNNITDLSAAIGTDVYPFPNKEDKTRVSALYLNEFADGKNKKAKASDIEEEIEEDDA